MTFCSEDDREEIVTAIVDGIVSQLTLEEMRSYVWDGYYEDVVWRELHDLQMLAEEYAPDLLGE